MRNTHPSACPPEESWHRASGPHSAARGIIFHFFFHSLTSVMVGDFMMSDDDDRRKHRNSAQGRGAEYYRIADLSSCDRHGFASAAAHPVRCSLKKRSAL